MHPVDLTEFPNKSNWEVVHLLDDQMYHIKNDKGSSLPGRYTNRSFAEKALYDYLTKATKVNDEINAKKKAEPIVYAEISA